MKTALLVSALLASAIAPWAYAQTPAAGATPGWPTKPIRLVTSVPAGGTPDVVARMITPGMSSILGQQLVVDNRGGAAGQIGAELVARAVPDGYTLFFSSAGSLTILPHLQKKAPYDTVRDFAPVSLVCSGPFLLVLHPAVPVKSVKDLLALTAAQPGKLNYASAGNGAPNHLAMELLRNLSGMNITHVPYKGAPQALVDILGGNMHMTLNSIPPTIQHIKAGRLRLIAVSSAKRSPQLPDVPTIAESGVPGYAFTTWFGMMAPAATPKNIIARLQGVAAQVVNTPETRAQFEKLGYDAVASTPAEFATHLRAEYEKNGKIIKLIGAKVD